MTTITYSVRIISDAEELANAFRLRYRIYKTTYPKAVEMITEDFETDVYDLRSVHLGLYAESGNNSTLVGYTRLVIPQVFASQYDVLFFRQHPMYRIRKSCEQPERIAMLDGLDDLLVRGVVDSHCLTMERRNEVYCEISRFIIDNCHRSLSLATFFVTRVVQRPNVSASVRHYLVTRRSLLRFHRVASGCSQMYKYIDQHVHAAFCKVLLFFCGNSTLKGSTDL